MPKLNSYNVIRFLKESKDNYLKHYFSGGTVYNGDADELGDVSQKVIDNLFFYMYFE